MKEKQLWEMTRDEFISEYLIETVPFTYGTQFIGLSGYGYPITDNKKSKQEAVKAVKDYLSTHDNAWDRHKDIILMAISDGEQIPDHVLLDYPDIKIY